MAGRKFTSCKNGILIELSICCPKKLASQTYQTQWLFWTVTDLKVVPKKSQCGLKEDTDLRKKKRKVTHLSWFSGMTSLIFYSRWSQTYIWATSKQEQRKMSFYSTKVSLLLIYFVSLELFLSKTMVLWRRRRWGLCELIKNNNSEGNGLPAINIDQCFIRKERRDVVVGHWNNICTDKTSRRIIRSLSCSSSPQ